MGAILAANLAGYKGKLTSSKGKVCGFGAVITRILKHVDFDFGDSEVAVDKSNKSNWSNLDVGSLIHKEFLAGPFSKMPTSNTYVYVFQDRARRPLYCRLPQVGLTSLISADAVEFLPPTTALIEKPSYFAPKYGSKGKALEVEEEEQEEGDIQAETEDDSQPRHLLSPDSSQYRLEDLPPNANPKQQQQWMRESIKTNNDMLHKMWAAISKIRPCRCSKDDVVQQDNATSSSSSGSSGTRRQSKKSKRTEATEGTSGAADAE